MAKARKEVRILCCKTKPLELMVQDTILDKSFGDFLCCSKKEDFNNVTYWFAATQRHGDFEALQCQPGRNLDRSTMLDLTNKPQLLGMCCVSFSSVHYFVLITYSSFRPLLLYWSSAASLSFLKLFV
ncbi:hypothetical protein [Flagellimonas sp.]|uniref:hypothetical protein n=1 Tax=Flagellimonas sp. TaxID=2058762 RepID=UPI003AB2C19D